MMKLRKVLWIVVLVLVVTGIGVVEGGRAGDKSGEAEKKFEEDVIKTKTGDLKITFIGHGTLMFVYKDKVVHVDPYGRLADYSKLPKADLVLVTHEHGDHLDTKAIGTIRQEQTKVVLTKECAGKMTGGIVMKNGDVRTVAGL